MNWRKCFWRLFFVVWVFGSVSITLMVIHTLRIPLNPVQRISQESAVRPAIPDCSAYAPAGERRYGAGIDEFLDRSGGSGLPDASRSEGLLPRADGEGCLKEREDALAALADWRRDTVYAYHTGIFWYRAAFLLAAIALWSLMIWGLFYLGVRVARAVNRRRGVVLISGRGPDRPAGDEVDPYILKPVKFDPYHGPVPIPGIDPPSNLVRLTWAEMKRISDAFREFEIPGPGICLSCRKKGVNDMHPIEDMYTLMDGARSDALAGLSRKRSPFFVGTCRACAPEVYETQTKDDQRVEERSTGNAVFILCAVTVCALLLMLLVRI